MGDTKGQQSPIQHKKLSQIKQGANGQLSAKNVADEALQKAEDVAWMDIAEQWMKKENDLKAQMADLEDELNQMDAERMQALVQHEKQLAQVGQEAKEREVVLERQLAKLKNHNKIMSTELSILKDDLAEERQRADKPASQIDH